MRTRLTRKSSSTFLVNDSQKTPLEFGQVEFIFYFCNMNENEYMDYYCDMNNKNMEYGFFKNTVNIFNVVTKADTYTWYCTKVVWWVYNKYGWDIDSNSNQIDWTTSGLYTLVKDYYAVRFFYSAKKRNEAINDYIATAKQNIVGIFRLLPNDLDSGAGAFRGRKHYDT